MSPNTIRKLLREMKVPIRPSTMQLTSKHTTSLLSRDQINKLISDYKCGIGLKNLGIRYKASDQRVRKILCSNNITINKATWMGKEERHKRIIELYQNGKNSPEISRILRICQSAVCKCLCSANIERRSKYVTSRRYIINPNTLCDFSNEKASYWFGFMCADGYLAKNRNRLVCSLRGSDIGHLFLFARDLQTTKIPKLVTMKTGFSRKKASQIIINNYYLCKAYRDNGFYNYKQGENLNKIKILNHKHFLRGVMDGDGVVIISKQLRLTVGFCDPHYSVIKWLGKQVRKITGLNENTPQRYGSCYYLYWRGKNALKLCRALYLSQSRCLKRKFARIAPYIMSFVNRPSSRPQMLSSLPSQTPLYSPPGH